MPPNRVVLESHFKQAIDVASDRFSDAIEKAIDAGEREANIRIERTDAQRGYNLPASVESHKLGEKSGYIEHPMWQMRFFEFGTVYIDAAPFMRPGHRKMRAVFKEEVGDLFKGWRTLRRR